MGLGLKENYTVEQQTEWIDQDHHQRLLIQLVQPQSFTKALKPPNQYAVAASMLS